MKFTIPNIRDMVLGVKLGFDQNLMRFGVKKVLRSEAPTFEKGQNSKLERYLSYQQKRLEKLSSDPDRFWTVANTLLQRSKSFRILAIRNVRPNWYKDTEWKRVRCWFDDLDRICSDKPNTFEIRRTAIPKPDGDVRYINDPGVPMRLYLWMLNLMLHYWLKDRLYDGQHGHRSGKGALTCWREVLGLMNKYQYVYEFDYKKFHDQIDRKILMESLLRMGIPLSVSARLVELSSAYVTVLDKNDPRYSNFIVEGKYKHFYRGVVQGSNIAGLLGLCVLEALGVYDIKNGRYVGYADDGLIFADDPSAIDEWKSKLDPVAGVTAKESKSGWVKFNGQWLKEMKFVGLSYDGLVGVLSAATHSGKTKAIRWEENEAFNVDADLAEFMKGLKLPYISNRIKTLDHRSGRAYLGLMMSEVWKGSPKVKDGSAGLLVPKSFAERIYSVWGDVTLANMSSYAYTLLGGWMRHHRPVRVLWKGHAEKPTSTFVDQGGFLLVRQGQTILQSIKLKDGMDLVPSESKKASPRVVYNLRLKVNPSVANMWNHKW